MRNTMYLYLVLLLFLVFFLVFFFIFNINIALPVMLFIIIFIIVFNFVFITLYHNIKLPTKVKTFLFVLYIGFLIYNEYYLVLLIITFFYISIYIKNFNNNNIKSTLMNDQDNIDYHLRVDFPYINIIRYPGQILLILPIVIYSYFPEVINLIDNQYLFCLLTFSLFINVIVMIVRIHIILYGNPHVSAKTIAICKECALGAFYLYGFSTLYNFNATSPVKDPLYLPGMHSYQIYKMGYAASNIVELNHGILFRSTFPGTPVPVLPNGHIDIVATQLALKKGGLQMVEEASHSAVKGGIAGAQDGLMNLFRKPDIDVGYHTPGVVRPQEPIDMVISDDLQSQISGLEASQGPIEVPSKIDVQKKISISNSNQINDPF